MGRKLSKADEALLFLSEMATIGHHHGLSFHVYYEPLKNPSFHVRIGGEAEFVIQLKDLTILEVKFKSKRFPYKKGDKLAGEFGRLVKEFLGMPNKTSPHQTNRDIILSTWELINGQ